MDCARMLILCKRTYSCTYVYALPSVLCGINSLIWIWTYT